MSAGSVVSAWDEASSVLSTYDENWLLVPTLSSLSSKSTYTQKLFKNFNRIKTLQTLQKHSLQMRSLATVEI